MKQSCSIQTLRWWTCALLVFLAHSAHAATPCTTASTECAEWVKLNSSGAKTKVFRTHSLDIKDENLTQAFVMIHGQNRDADTYFQNALAFAALSNALDHTAIVAPRFASHQGQHCHDVMELGELNWNCQQAPEGWRVGGSALNEKDISSFDVLDEILRKMARKEIFPNLKSIVVMGHSAGAQYVTRYGMVNQVHGDVGVPLTYVVANPSSYAYLDGRRPLPAAFSADGFIPSRLNELSMSGSESPLFSVPDQARGCQGYDDWPYGLRRRVGYMAKATDDQLKKQFAMRRAVYLLGELDTQPIKGFDASCPAAAQGPNRLARGLAFARYVQAFHETQHQVMVVPGCGHDARCMLMAEPVRALIFQGQ